MTARPTPTPIDPGRYKGSPLDQLIQIRMGRFPQPPRLSVVPEPLGRVDRLPFLYQGRGAKRPYNPYLRSGPIEILPGVRSTDPRLVRVIAGWSRDVLEQDPPFVNEFGFANERGVVGDLEGLRCRAGLLMSAMHVPPPVRAPDLSPQFDSPKHAQLAAITRERIFRRREKGTPYHISTVSSTSAPFFRYEAADKQLLAEVALSQPELALNAATKGDAAVLYNALNWVDSHHLVVRYQAENPDKAREVTVPFKDGEQTGWRRITANKYAHGEALGFKGKYYGGCRVRTAFGAGGTSTVFTACAMASIRAFYLNAYAFTFKHRGAEDLFRKIRRATAVVGVDVKNMDQNYPPFLLHYMALGLAEFHDPRWAAVAQRQLYAPYFAPQPGIGLHPVMVGDAFAPENQNDYYTGLPSGIAQNPDLGRSGMIFAYLALLDDLFNIFPSDYEGMLKAWDEIMEGRHPLVALLNSSDDNVFLFFGEQGPRRRLEMLEALRRSQKKEKPASSYFDMQPEDGVRFLGWVLRSDADGNMLMPIPDPTSLWKNLLVPEHPIGSKHRLYWAAGILARFEHYKQAGPIVGEWYAAFADRWAFEFRGDIPPPIALATRALQLNPKQQELLGLDRISAEVLHRPELLHFRYRPEEVNDLVRRLLTFSIPGDRIERALGSYLGHH